MLTLDEPSPTYKGLLGNKKYGFAIAASSLSFDFHRNKGKQSQVWQYPEVNTSTNYRAKPIADLNL